MKLRSRGVAVLVLAIVLLAAAGAAAVAEARIAPDSTRFLIRVLDPATGADVVPPIRPYGPGFRGGINVAATDVNGDGVSEIVASPRVGARPVRVFEADGTRLGGFFPFGKRFRGGVFVAVGDLTGDMRHEIVTGAGAASPRVNVWSYVTVDYLKLAGFLAYDSSFRGGVRVAAGDVNGDGKSEVIASPGPGAPPRVRVFGPKGEPVSSFLAFAARFRGGVFVAAGDVDGDGRSEVIFSSQSNPFVGMQRLGLRIAHRPWGRSYDGGLRVAAGDVNGDGRADIITGPGPGVRARVRTFTGLELGPLAGFRVFFGRRYRGGVSVAAGDVNGDKRFEIIAAPTNQKPRRPKPRTG